MPDNNQNKHADSDNLNMANQYSIHNEYGEPLIPSPPHQQLEPVPNSERLGVMDSLRGFALIAILMMNIEWFNRPTSKLGRFDHSINGADYAVSWFIKAFIEGKFYKLFALLFGMGFAVMLIKAQQAGKPFVSMFIRRMLTLFIFGMAHYIFLWDGDILHDYAFAGLLLLGWVQLVKTESFQRFAKPVSFLKLGLSVLMIPVLVMILGGTYSGMTKDNLELNENWHEQLAIITLTDTLLDKENETLYSDNALSDPESKIIDPFILDTNQENDLDNNDEQSAVDQIEEKPEYKDVDLMTREERISYIANLKVEDKLDRISAGEKETKAVTDASFLSGARYRLDWLSETLIEMVVFSIVMLVPIFLIGYWFVASGILNNPKQHQNLFKSLGWAGTIIGSGVSIAALLFSQSVVVQNILYLKNIADVLFEFSQYILAAGYLGIMVSLYQSEKWKVKMDIIAPLGRMALTNYIMHSVILGIIFYGYGFNMFGQIQRTEQMLIVVAIISFQLVLSTWWLNLFRFGPLEWFWRCITYNKLQPMRL